MKSEGKRLFHKIIFVLICIILNLAGHRFAKALELPFWLDTIGTALTACVFGPVHAAAVGLVSNLCLGITDRVTALYSLINVGIGIIVGIFARRGMMKDLFNTLCVSVVSGFFSVFCALPLNYFFTDGYTDNKWGDALFLMLEEYKINLIVRSGLSQAFIDIPDKVISLICVFYLLKLLDKIKIYDRRKENEKQL